MERIYKRRVDSRQICTTEFATELTFVSGDLNRVVAALIDRRGNVESVMVGDSERVFLPDVGRLRAGSGRFRGLRLIRTILSDSPSLNDDDFADLAKLRLDLVVGVQVGPAGYPGKTIWAHLLPQNPEEKLWDVLEAKHVNEIDVPFDTFIADLEGEFSRKAETTRLTDGQPAMLIHVATPEGRDPNVEVEEMSELCATAGIELVDTIIQKRSTVHPKYVVGSGKIEEIELKALQQDVDLLIFGQDLTPAQLRHITEKTESRVIDRTQLILDIFAQHAKTKDGRTQVELAQLKYNLPRLSGKGTSMSRLMGGVGGRGPGETKLEIDRRRARDRIRRLEKDLEKVSQQRQLRRARRVDNVPIVSIVGYTNAGKSTLLNQLTNAEALSEDKLFATLSPMSRRLRLPKERDIVLTDTVGFIHDLPKDLVNAFKATLEELEQADLLVHVVDISTDGYKERIDAVNRILFDLGVNTEKQVMVFNKIDLVDRSEAVSTARLFGAVAVSAHVRETLTPLVDRITDRMIAKD